MYTLHQTSICLLNHCELREAAVNPMGCISMPMNFLVQTPVFGAVSSVRRKKKQAWGLVTKRRHNFSVNALSATRVEDNMVVKEDAEFKSLFNEHLETMESIRANREKKNVYKGSDRANKRTDAAFGKDAPRHQKRGGEAVKSRWVKGSDSKVDNQTSAKFDGVADKKSLGGSIQTRNSVRSEKESRHVGSKTGLSKKLDVLPAASKSSEAVKSRWVKSSYSKVDHKKSARFDGVTDNKSLGVSIRTRNGVSSEKDLRHVGSIKGLSKKFDVRAATSKSSEAVKFKWVKSSDSKVDDKTSGRFDGVTDKKSLGGSIQTRNGVRSEKELRHVGSQKGFSMKLDVHAAASKSSEAVKSKWLKSSDSKVDKTSARFDGVTDKKSLGGSIQTRNSERSEKELRYVRSQNGLTKKHDVHAAASKSSEIVKKKTKSMNETTVANYLESRNSVKSEKELSNVGSNNDLSKKLDVRAAASKTSNIVKKKIKPTNEMSADDGLEMDRFIFQSPDDVLNLPRVSQMEMEERIQKLAMSLNNAHINMPQWMFAKTMRSARIKFSDHSMLRVIQILGKFHNWQRVLQVVEWLQMQERFKSRKIRYIYTAALDVLGKSRRPVEALNLFYAMQRHSSTYPDIVTYHSIAITLGQAGHMKELFDVIDSMRSMPKNFKIDVLDDWDPRLEPDIVIYNAVLNGCVKQKEWEGAMWVLQKLEETGQQPSSTTYGLAMEVMLACGKYDLVHEYFKLVQRSSVPNALTYRVVVNALWREGKADEAIAAVQDMETRGLIGSASLYYDLARCLCSVGRCDEGLMQVDKICNVASKPLVVTYTGLIQACVANGKIHDAASIFSLMQKHCSPNTVTCNIMLKGYLGYGMFDEAKDLFLKMITHSGHNGSKVRSRIKPDLHTFNMMLKACIREERWDEFEYAYGKLLQHRHPFNTKRHLWMVLQASGAGKVETVEITWSHLVQTNRVPPPGLVKERFRLKMEDDNFIEAVSSVARHPSTHQQSFSKESWLQLLKDNAHSFKKEALEHLMQEVNKSLSMSESPNLIYQNLLDSCMEFVKHDNLVTSTA